jgi:hypothetical protein
MGAAGMPGRLWWRTAVASARASGAGWGLRSANAASGAAGATKVVLSPDPRHVATGTPTGTRGQRGLLALRGRQRAAGGGRGPQTAGGGAAASQRGRPGAGGQRARCTVRRRRGRAPTRGAPLISAGHERARAWSVPHRPAAPRNRRRRAAAPATGHARTYACRRGKRCPDFRAACTARAGPRMSRAAVTAPRRPRPTHPPRAPPPAPAAPAALPPPPKRQRSRLSAALDPPTTSCGGVAIGWRRVLGRPARAPAGPGSRERDRAKPARPHPRCPLVAPQNRAAAPNSLTPSSRGGLTPAAPLSPRRAA